MRINPARLQEFAERRDVIRDWIEGDASLLLADQKQLEANSPERAYWHHGYQAALTDVIEHLLSDRHNADSLN